MSEPVIPVKSEHELARYRTAPVKKSVNERLREENDELKRVLGQINHNTEAAFKNEQYTRQRVVSLEAFRSRGFWGE